MKKVFLCTLIMALLLTGVCMPADAAAMLRPVTPEEIDGFFTMPKSELMMNLGTAFQLVGTGAEGWLEGMEYEDLGLTFAYDIEDDDVLLWIDCSSEFEIFGIRAEAMSFAEIMKCLGDAEIEDVFVETPDHPAYVIQYQIGGAVYSFLSFDADGGGGSMLTIYPAISGTV